MPDSDINARFSRATPGVGDTVLYSTMDLSRPAVPGEKSMKTAHGWFEANQDATVKVQGFDRASGTWRTINGNGVGQAAPAAGGPADLVLDLPPDDRQIVVNFAVAPTTWRHSDSWRLSR